MFSSFVSRHGLHRGKRDLEFRRPEVLAGLARELDILPSPSRTCLVTGSKGKGTVSRMVAWNLSASGSRVGLVLTPEELDHLDRIRITNEAIPEQDFCRIVSALRPLLDEALGRQPRDFYFSPSGLFLLVALAWFAEQNVDAWVIEGGRGVKSDEIGQLEAQVGVVTNVLPEHLLRLGPTLQDIADDKLSLARRCQTLVAGQSLQAWRHLAAGQAGAFQGAESPGRLFSRADRPRWLAELDAIAEAAARQIQADLAWQRFDTPAFFFARGGIADGRAKPGTLCCDAAIHADCLDLDFLRQTGLAEGAALVGLSADKDGEGILSRLLEAGFKQVYTVGLSSRVGHIQAWRPPGGAARQVAALELVGDADSSLLGTLLELTERHGGLYVVGVQMFIRSLRQLLGVDVLRPGPHLERQQAPAHA